jgi:hypothetical protein
MNPVMIQALDLMLVAYPAIFAVTAVFMILTVALKKAFPATQDEE